MTPTDTAADGTFTPFRVGEVRRGQVLHTFGIGSVVDLPHFCVMPMGLQAWNEQVLMLPRHEVREDRLLDVVRGLLGDQVDHLYLPPVPDAGADVFRNPFSADARIGVPVVPFPRWARCPKCELLAPLDYGVWRLEGDGRRADRTRYVHHNCSKPGTSVAVPARFVVACPNGHIEDFPWREFVHRGDSSCTGSLRFSESGLSSEVADLWVACQGCNVSRSMTDAFGEEGRAWFESRGCSGRHPHLGAGYVDEDCDARPKALLAGASNLWFSVIVPAISIPRGGDEVGALLDDSSLWDRVDWIDDIAQVAKLREKKKLGPLAAHSDAAILAAILARNSDSNAGAERRSVRSLKEEEWQVLVQSGEKPSSKDFEVRSASGVPEGFEGLISDVILADRLRVVRAMTGFTRIDSPGNYGDADDLPEVQRVPLRAGDPTWVPATEVRGEGIFIRFDEDALEAWCRKPGVKALELEFRRAHEAFRSSRNIESPADRFPGMRFVMIHTLAHALIRQLSIECGYSSSSVEERIYCTPTGGQEDSMAGLLIYTAAPDSEGTLGGLVALGEPAQLGRHLRTALGRLSLCPSDPLCSEHLPEQDRGGVLHGASCHSCTFVSETSCETGNRYLDRSVIVQTVTGEVEPFFPPQLASSLV